MSVAARAFGSKEELLALLETRSAYTDGFVEGVYLRIDDAAHCVARGKCVRPDFILGRFGKAIRRRQANPATGFYRKPLRT